MKLSLSNWIFYRYPLDKNIQLVKSLGFKNLEFNLICVKDRAKESVDEAKKLISSFGLNCLTVHSAGLYAKNSREVEKAVFYGKTSIDFAYKLSAPILVVHSYVSRKVSAELRGKFLSQIFSRLKNYANRLNVKLALENLSLDSKGFGRSVSEVKEVLNVIGVDDVGLTLDFCHSQETGETFKFLDEFKGKILNIHLSGNSHKTFTRKTKKLEDFLKKLLEANYSGPLTLELKPKCRFKNVLKTRMVVEGILKSLGCFAF